MPGDVLEFATGSGAAAFIIGKEDIIAEIEATYSYTTDTPDFWRRDTSEFPLHGARFTGEPAYFKHVINAAKGLLTKINATVDDFDYIVFHQPNAKFPSKAAKILGVPQEKIEPGLVVKVIGNTYSGSSLIGLAAVLDIAKPNDRILIVSYGSGAGSDAFVIKVTKNIEKIREKSVPTVSDYVNRKCYIDYATYVKFRKKLKGL
jgi:hydroxymethylglutaryl-CoA synthase